MLAKKEFFNISVPKYLVFIAFRFFHFFSQEKKHFLQIWKLKINPFPDEIFLWILYSILQDTILHFYLYYFFYEMISIIIQLMILLHPIYLFKFSCSRMKKQFPNIYVFIIYDTFIYFTWFSLSTSSMVLKGKSPFCSANFHNFWVSF